MSNPRTSALPIFKKTIVVQKHLREICGRSVALSYALFFNGPFLDYGLRERFLLNLASCLQGRSDTKSGSGAVAEIFHGGDRKFSTTTQAGAERAVVGIVTPLEMMRNKTVYVCEADVSQKQLLRLVGNKKVMEEVRTVELESQGYAEVQNEKPD